MASLEIREARVRDARGIARVHVDCWRTTYAGLLPQTLLDALDYDHREAIWREALQIADESRRVAFVAVRGDEIVGFANAGPARHRTSDERGEVYAIYVLAEQQRTGIGRALFRAVMAGLHEADLEPIVLWVLQGNPASAFYEKMSGTFAGKREDQIGGATVTELGYRWESAAPDATTDRY
jgi:ribosomal protein S18 acetylase RimI-like enzyme